jgi:hypothetical protein
VRPATAAGSPPQPARREQDQTASASRRRLELPGSPRRGATAQPQSAPSDPSLHTALQPSPSSVLPSSHDLAGVLHPSPQWAIRQFDRQASASWSLLASPASQVSAPVIAPSPQIEPAAATTQ